MGILHAKGHILRIYMGYISINNNNVDELWDLLHSLQVANFYQYSKLIVEGDSQIILNFFVKILNGVDSRKISLCWHLTNGLKAIADLVQPHLYFIPSHIRRCTNQVVDHLANIRVDLEGKGLLCMSSTNNNHPVLKDCIVLTLSSECSLDGVTDCDKR